MKYEFEITYDFTVVSRDYAPGREKITVIQEDILDEKAKEELAAQILQNLTQKNRGVGSIRIIDIKTVKEIYTFI